MPARLSSHLLVGVTAVARVAAADPVATVAKPPARDARGPVSEKSSAPDRTSEPATEEPSPERLAHAPAADAASGVAVPARQEEHPIANTVLALPRLTAHVLLLGPRYAAAEVDHYLENRSPNAFGRDVEQAWRFGATVEWEKALGADLAVRVGRSLAEATAIDGYAGVLGARGESAGVRARLGRYTPARIEPELSIDAGANLERAFAGIDTRGPLAKYEVDRAAATAALTASPGQWRASARAVLDREHPGDPNGVFVDNYDPMTIGFDETQQAATGELEIAYDTRHPSYKWIRAAAPSTGTLVRLSGAHTAGTASRTGSFAFDRAGLDAQQLFNLFHGDRVLSIAASLDAITRNDVPFDRLPALGGADRMRAFARDELRATSLAYGNITYEWPLGGDSRAYMFAEGAATQRGQYGDYGGGIRLLYGASSSGRIQVAASGTGDVGVFFQLGAL